MEWFVSHKSALEFWQKAQASEVLAKKRMRSCTPPKDLPDARGLRLENPFGLSLPLHILVENSNARNKSGKFVCHIGSRWFPGGSFIQVAPGIIMSSPELCFVQMAGEMSLIQLVMLGYEICGSYRLDSEASTGRGFRDDVPLTSVNALKSFVAKLKGYKGIKNARRALRFIADGSASPMETILAMFLTLPYMLGGYSFPPPLLNCPIDVPDSSKKAKGKSRYYCDMYWPDEQVDVEYDSDFYHTKEERIAKDAIRRNALTSVGIAVVTVSRKQINNTAELRRVAMALSGLLGKQLRCPKPEFTRNHAALRKELLRRVSVNNW